jgi:Fe-S-cluster containining protein
MQILKQIIPTKLCLKCDICCRFLDKNAILAPLFLPHEITSKIKPYLNKKGQVILKPCHEMYACPFFNPKTNEAPRAEARGFLERNTASHRGACFRGARHRGERPCSIRTLSLDSARDGSRDGELVEPKGAVLWPRMYQCSIYSRRPFDCQLYPFAIMFDEKCERVILGIDKKCPFAANPENETCIKNYFHYLIDLLEKRENALLIAKNPLFIGKFQEDVIKFSHLDTLAKILINNPEKNGFKRLSLKDKPVIGRHFQKIKKPDSSQNFISLYIWKDKNPVWYRKSKNTLQILFETESGYIDFGSIKKFQDYIYLTKDLAGLKGNRYKHKRANCNYFSKHYSFKYLPYKPGMKQDCLKLYQKWASDRKKKFPDPYYHKLLEDSLSAHRLAIENFKALGLTGRVIKIKNEICAYTFGFELKKDMFCVLLEVCNLRFKGISEFIFREFCREMSAYKYINTMDDSGLENLRIAKLSFHPTSL